MGKKKYSSSDDDSSDEDYDPKKKLKKKISKSKSNKKKFRATENYNDDDSDYDEIEEDEILMKDPYFQKRRDTCENCVKWDFEGKFNGTEQVLNCPFVSNDLVEKQYLRAVDLKDKKTGKYKTVSTSEPDVRDNDSKKEIIVGYFYPPTCGKVVPLKQFEYKLLAPDFTIILFGRRRSGKSYFLIPLLFQLRPYFPLVFCFTRTGHTGDLGRYFSPDLVFDDFSHEKLLEILELQKPRYKEALDSTVRIDENGNRVMDNINILIVCDDVFSSTISLRHDKAFQTVFFEGRHYNLSFIITCQDLKFVPPAVKGNTDLTIFFPAISKRDKEAIVDNNLPFLRNLKDAIAFNEVHSLKHIFIAVPNARATVDPRECIHVGIVPGPETIPRFIMGSYECWKDHTNILKNDPQFNDLAMKTEYFEWGIIPTTPVKVKTTEEEAALRENGMKMDFVKTFTKEFKDYSLFDPKNSYDSFGELFS